MSRIPAKITQADVARALRAAKQAGATGVELRPDGSLFIRLTALPADPDEHLEPNRPIVL